VREGVRVKKKEKEFENVEEKKESVSQVFRKKKALTRFWLIDPIQLHSRLGLGQGFRDYSTFATFFIIRTLHVAICTSYVFFFYDKNF
jgi:hypothetical protein